MGVSAVAEPKERRIERPVSSKREKEFRDAIERVYRRYGRDLSAFLRDVKKESELLKKG
ncbi:MAG TPA: hypothetical protein VMX16_19130 [Terriglobia bacterium]|nr:hypothetical protein [Terriglobia bacterium]